MPRKPKPYLWRGWWVSNFGGTRHKLCPAEDGREAADDALLDLRQEARRFIGRRIPKLTVAELGARFLEAVKTDASPETYVAYRRWVTAFCETHGTRIASEITALDAQDFKERFAKGKWNPRHRAKSIPYKRKPKPTAEQLPRPYKPNSVNCAIGTMRTCWNWAVTMQLVSSNPFKAVKKLVGEQRERVLTDAEFQALLRHSPRAFFRQMLLVLRYSGARPGELRGLTWDQIDWEQHQLRLVHHKTKRKTRRVRTVPMHPIVERLLRWRHARFARQSQFVFLTCRGRPLQKNYPVVMLAEARKAAGIGPDANGEKVVLYTNRHTFVTAAALTPDVKEQMVSELAGHTNPQMTKRYTHLANQHRYEATLKVGESLRPRRSQQPQPTAQPPGQPKAQDQTGDDAAK